jgi:hypothetical protein
LVSALSPRFTVASTRAVTILASSAAVTEHDARGLVGHTFDRAVLAREHDRERTQHDQEVTVAATCALTSEGCKLALKLRDLIREVDMVRRSYKILSAADPCWRGRGSHSAMRLR